jgi:hypothetical protein
LWRASGNLKRASFLPPVRARKVKVNYSARGAGQKLVKVMISKKRGTPRIHTEYRTTEEINDGRVQAHKQSHGCV